MKLSSTRPGSWFLGSARGDASILYVFITLMIILLGSLVIAVLVVMTQRRTRDVAASAQAFYASGTGAERGFSTYMWSCNDGTCARTCLDRTNGGQSALADDAGTLYTIIVSGNPWADPPTDCPTLDGINPLVVPPDPRGLCLTSVGAVQNGTIQRRIESDTQINCR